MPYSFLEHTADVRMRVTGGTPQELFCDALLGMTALMSPEIKEGSEKINRAIALDAPDRTALLIDFLNDALVWMHAEKEAYTKVRFRSLGERSLEAELEGRRAASFGGDVKAATYHEAEVLQMPDGMWRTIIIFDI